MARRLCSAVIFASMFLGALIVQPSVSAQTGTPASPAPASSAVAAKPAAPKKPTVTRTIEAQLSGLTTEYADQIYARLSVQESRQPRNWYLRGSYTSTATESGTWKVNVTTTRLDGRVERIRTGDRYNVLIGVMNRRDRDLTRTTSEQTGYHFLSYGVGKHLDIRNKGDIGLGLLTLYDDGDTAKPAVGCSIIGRRPLSKKLTLDSQILALQPLDRLRSTKVDSEIGLSYELTQGFSLRLGWSANNLVRPIRGKKEWDSIVRLTISFRRTTTR
ncbi:MAG TPA: DUF481 domain-containing protein [Armatimonadota bacterium]|nr:DUF481 domain-containing protein [Armatimonadota bacterium]